ncbi:MAG: glycogen/starch synthase [bacterium]|nr:glycogen/starch synthase [bacterium]
MGIFNNSAKMKVLFVTAEEFPFAKVGGLGEVMFSLPRALSRAGCDARVFMPKYGSIKKELLDNAKYVYEQLSVPTDPERATKNLICNVLKLDAAGDPHSPVTTYFLENQEYYELRSNVYGYKDDMLRFALLSRGCLEFLNSSGDWLPDIIVATDWMTGYLPNYLKTDYKDYVHLKDLATVFSIHNIYSQGPSRRHRFIPQTELDDGHGSIPNLYSERMLHINAMRRGIMYSDMVNTVSPTYAKEIATPEFGEGLDILLKESQDRLVGILNGIDYETRDPEKDSQLAKNYNKNSLDKRKENKTALQKRFGLPEEEDVFVVGMVSRLSRQKGLALLEPIIGDFLKATRSQLIVVGTGDSEIMDFLISSQKKYPDNMRAHLLYDTVLPHMIYSGADAVLIPSQFEPCGLTQMEAMRYGAIPVARRTGGLVDTIEDFNPTEETGTGFLFGEFDSMQLLVSLTRAFVNWKHKKSWAELQKRAMSADFSWDYSAKEYIKLFERVLKMKEGGKIAEDKLPPPTLPS